MTTCKCGRAIPPNVDSPPPGVEECERCQMFVCATCGKDTTWDNGCDGDLPNSCSDCWFEWAHGTVDAVLDDLCYAADMSRKDGETNDKLADRYRQHQHGRLKLAWFRLESDGPWKAGAEAA